MSKLFPCGDVDDPWAVIVAWGIEQCDDRYLPARSASEPQRFNFPNELPLQIRAYNHSMQPFNMQLFKRTVGMQPFKACSITSWAMIVLLLLAHALPAMADDDERPVGAAASGEFHIKTRAHLEELLAKEQERLIDVVSKGSVNAPMSVWSTR